MDRGLWQDNKHFGNSPSAKAGLKAAFARLSIVGRQGGQVIPKEARVQCPLLVNAGRGPIFSEALGMPLLADMGRHGTCTACERPLDGVRLPGEAGPDGDRTPRTPRTPSRGQRKLRCLVQALGCYLQKPRMNEATP